VSAGAGGKPLPPPPLQPAAKTNVTNKREKPISRNCFWKTPVIRPTDYLLPA
jgi:hypothetical protein